MNFLEKLPISLYLSNLKLIDHSSSKNYKKIQLFKHPDLGRVFIIDDEIQHIEAWSPFYHEILIHLPCAFLKNVEKVLILGGGDFFAAKEIMKYDSVKEVTMVDHDSKVIELMCRNYKHASKIVKKKRFNLKITDAFDYLEKLETKYDLIINDSVDLIENSKLQKTNLFNSLSLRLNPNGVCCDLIYRHIFEKLTTRATFKLLKKNKLNLAYSLITVPEYPGILHLLLMWGNNKKITQNFSTSINGIQKKWSSSPSKNLCEYYNSRFLNYYLYLPPYLKRITK